MKHNVLINSWRMIVMSAVMLLLGVTVQAQNVDQTQNSNKEYVRFVEVSATKTYPEGNQITYVKATGLPNIQEVADKMEKYVIKNMRVSRLKIYLNQDEFMFDGDADVNPEHVVDEMNIFLRNYNMELEKIEYIKSKRTKNE